MTDPRTLATEALQAVEGVTDGPWEARRWFDDAQINDAKDEGRDPYWDDHSEWAFDAEPFEIVGPEPAQNAEYAFWREPNATFIAYARNNIEPLAQALLAALDEVERLRGLRDRYPEFWDYLADALSQPRTEPPP